ncbi:hypothetical protein C3744_17005 [Priestia megaterium]|uniref:Uncharacterized protein n=1 Tax=Priestia megaterium TaxID=1404 RepID=A0A3D8X0H6_PRIMG|nr:hypothetical protein C3744_17005 [Priestia megaterium]
MLLAVDWRATRRFLRKAKPCIEIDCGARSDPYSIIYPICPSLDWRDFVMSQSLFNMREALMKIRPYVQAKGNEFVS